MDFDVDFSDLEGVLEQLGMVGSWLPGTELGAGTPVQPGGDGSIPPSSGGLPPKRRLLERQRRIRYNRMMRKVEHK